MHNSKFKRKNMIRDTVLIVLGILSASMGLKGFLLSSHFIDGGVTGISMLIANLTFVPISVSIFVINIPFLLLGYKRMGTVFAIKSALCITGLSLCIALLHFPDVTSDKLLTAVFGGFFIGVGIGLAIRGGAVLDGTDIAALLLSKKSSLLKVSDIILLLNVVIFSAAALLISIESALYSILTYLSASKMIDFIVNGIEQYSSVTIVSSKSDIVQAIITRQMGRGVTVYQAKKGYGKVGQVSDERDIIFTVVTRLEVAALKQKILRADPAAFIVQQSVDDTTGGLIKRQVLH